MDVVRPKSRLIITSESSDMSAVAALTSFSRSLVRRDQMRAGGSAESAIKRVADRIKISRGTFANIVRQKVKSVCISVGSRIIAASISDIENERKQLEHERELILSVAAPTNADDVAEVEAHLEAARAVLARMRAGR